jgi:hypothetical protein
MSPNFLLGKLFGHILFSSNPLGFELNINEPASMVINQTEWMVDFDRL